MWSVIEKYTRDIVRDILKIELKILENPGDYRLFDKLDFHFLPVEEAEGELTHFLTSEEFLPGRYYVIRTSLSFMLTIIPIDSECGISGAKIPAAQRFLFLGPYLPEKFSERMIEERRRELRISAGALSALRAFYTTVPTAWESHVEAVAAAVVRSSQGIEEPEAVERELVFRAAFMEKAGPTESFRAASQVLEQRYEEENRVLDAIRRGDEEMAVKMGREWSARNILPRPGDTVRGWKDLLLSGNTIYRKAAEQGDVHPVYLDQLSRTFALKIEACSSMRQLDAVQKDMVSQYCRLVRRYSLSKYSAPVREAMNYVNLNLTDDLSLRTVAGRLKLAPAYLSGLFKKEYGATLTEFIHERRCAYAADLLVKSDIPVAEAAAAAGFTDASYFSYLFKRLYRMTPTRYRMKQQGRNGMR